MSQNAQDLEAGNVKNLSDMAKFFEERLSSLPTKDYMDKRLSKIEEKAEDTAQGLKTLERRVRNMEEEKDKSIRGPDIQARMTTGRNDMRAPNAINELREEAFLKAIRSIRIWPIDGTNELEVKVDAFIKTALCMPTKELESVIIEDIYTVRSSPRSRQHNEVCVLLRDSDTRELVLSYARNLATYVDVEGNPTAGIRMEIPPHLLMAHKLLIMYGYGLKKRHGRETRRIIKFDLIEQSLYLSYKVPGNELWHDVTPAMAKSYKDRENERSLLQFSSTLSPPQSGPSLAPLTGANTTEMSSSNRMRNGGDGASNGGSRNSSQTWTPMSGRR